MWHSNEKTPKLKKFILSDFLEMFYLKYFLVFLANTYLYLAYCVLDVVLSAYQRLAHFSLTTVLLNEPGIILVLWITELKIREDESLAQGHTAQVVWFYRLYS